MSGIRQRIGRIVPQAILVVAVVAFALALTACGTVTTESADAPINQGLGYGEGDMAVQSSDSMRAVPEIAPVPPSDGAGVDASTVPPDERMVIRTLGLRLQVDEVEPAVQGVRDAVDDAGGMVTAVQLSSDDVPVYRYDASGTFADGVPLMGYVTARVPPDNLERFIETVSAIGTVLRQAEDESDVTQEHIDLKARLENLRSQEARLRDLFDRGEKIEDLLEVERELGRVRGEIESYEARVAYLERQAAMATVTVELTGRQAVIAPAGEDWGLVDAVRAGIRGLVSTINGLIYVTLSTLPLIVIALLAWLIARGFWRRRTRRNSRENRIGIDDAATPTEATSADGTDETR
ncbi:MAG: DUF4349 domain-containing protein [Clostridiales bacterium]|nr:DUF4349 domain-containing protein [Clostridiales bacterium]